MLVLALVPGWASASVQGWASALVPGLVSESVPALRLGLAWALVLEAAEVWATVTQLGPASPSGLASESRWPARSSKWLGLAWHFPSGWLHAMVLASASRHP